MSNDLLIGTSGLINLDENNSIKIDNGINLTNVTNNVDNVSLTSNNRILKYTLSLLSLDNNRSSSIQIISDKVFNNSVIIGNCNQYIDVFIHSVIFGSFKFDYQNMGSIINSSTNLIFNFIIF